MAQAIASNGQLGIKTPDYAPSTLGPGAYLVGDTWHDQYGNIQKARPAATAAPVAPAVGTAASAAIAAPIVPADTAFSSASGRDVSYSGGAANALQSGIAGAAGGNVAGTTAAVENTAASKRLAAARLGR